MIKPMKTVTVANFGAQYGAYADFVIRRAQHPVYREMVDAWEQQDEHGQWCLVIAMKDGSSAEAFEVQARVAFFTPSLANDPCLADAAVEEDYSYLEESYPELIDGDC
jgi:hypothetical protein